MKGTIHYYVHQMNIERMNEWCVCACMCISVFVCVCVIIVRVCVCVCACVCVTKIYLTIFNKIAIQEAHQMAVDKDAISLSRVYSYVCVCVCACVRACVRARMRAWSRNIGMGNSVLSPEHYPCILTGCADRHL